MQYSKFQNVKNNEINFQNEVVKLCIKNYFQYLSENYDLN